MLCPVKALSWESQLDHWRKGILSSNPCVSPFSCCPELLSWFCGENISSPTQSLMLWQITAVSVCQAVRQRKV